jgi:hypothetical protein
MDAVAKGDMKTAQRMVDAAAKEAGLKKKNLVRTLFTPREVDEIRPRAIEAVRSVAEGYVFNMDDSMDEEERWSNVGFDSNKLGFKTSGDDSYSIKTDYVNDTDDWLKIVETNNGKKSLLDYSLRPVEYKVPSDPVTYDDSGNVIPLSQRFNRRSEDIRNPMKTNPMDPRSAMTQIEGTKKTYAKAAKMLTGKVIDYGAGPVLEPISSGPRVFRWTPLSRTRKSGKANDRQPSPTARRSRLQATTLWSRSRLSMSWSPT